MSSLTATLPRSFDGSALVRAAADLLTSLFTPVDRIAASSAKAAGTLSLWDLYRLTAGSDTISPKLAAELRRHLAS